MIILETHRLRLRQFNIKDTRFILELLNSPGWLRYIGDRNVHTEKEAAAYLENGPMKSYRENGHGLSMVERKDDNTAIGMCGILKRPDLEYPDIGFALLPGFERQGYAHEIVTATLTNARTTLKIPVISAITLADNTRSITLLEKNGFEFVKTIRFPNKDEDLQLWCLPFDRAQGGREPQALAIENPDG